MGRLVATYCIVILALKKLCEFLYHCAPHHEKVAHFWYWPEPQSSTLSKLGLRVAGGFAGFSPVLTFKPSKTKSRSSSADIISENLSDC